MKKKGFRTENLGGSFNIDSNGMSIIGDLIVRRNSLTKSHSIIALNLQTVDDVEQVIRQCEALKGQMQGGSGEYRYPTHKDDMGFLCTDLTKSRINP